MELTEAMRTTGTCRRFRPDPVPDEVLHRAFEVARFGPQGGNRQPLRWVVVRDPVLKQALDNRGLEYDTAPGAAVRAAAGGQPPGRPGRRAVSAAGPAGQGRDGRQPGGLPGHRRPA